MAVALSLDFIRARRKKLGLTQADMAERLGMSNSSLYCKYENGSYRMEADMLPALAQALGVSIESMFTDKRNDHEDRLKELLRERGWTYRELASSIGISEITFYRKVNGRQKWLASEVADIVRTGALTVGEAWDIFMRKEGEENERGSEADVETQAEREGVPHRDDDGERNLHN